MALLSISEPSQGPAVSPDIVIGIDLGTTHSLVAAEHNGRVQVLQVADAKSGSQVFMLPSAVSYKDNQWLVGEPALARLTQCPESVWVSIKRFMGLSTEEVKQQLKSHPSSYHWNFDDPKLPKLGFVGDSGEMQWVSVVELSGKILQLLVDRAKDALGVENIDAAVITVPAYFDDAQRQAAKDAARLINLSVLRLINEPTAAALAYGLEKNHHGVYGVYDLGGGTFDISILRLEDGVFEVIATGGDTYLGGDDMDQAIADWLVKGLETPPTELDWPRLRNLARQAKETLSHSESVVIELEINQIANQLTLTRKTFDALIEPLVKRTVQTCKSVLMDAHLKADAIDGIVLVGGSTRVPQIRSAVSDLFKCPISSELNPDTLVALGAANQARQLAGSANGVLLLDVTPLSLGLETMGGLVEKIIPRNTPIPVTRKQSFTTFQTGQTGMSFHLVQGERDMVKDNRSLAKFELTGINPMVAGAAKVEVSFSVDADGLLSVSATDAQSGVVASVQVKPSQGLSEDQMQAMLKDSAERAKVDVAQRNLNERRIEADRLLVSLKEALSADEDLLDEIELRALKDAIAVLSKVRDTSDTPEPIRSAIESLNKISDVFAQRRMNASIRAALAGKAIEDL